MLRGLALAAVVFLLASGLTRAADPAPPSGFWKLAVPTGQGAEVIMMVAFTEQDGKWVGDYLAASEKLSAEPKFKSLKVNGDAIKFTIELGGREIVSFDGMVSKDKKKISGSMSVVGNPLVLTDMYPTKLKKLDDRFDLARELLTQMDHAPQLFEAALEVMSKAGVKKVPADEIRGILDRVSKTAAGYGPRWEREIALRMADALAGQEGFGDQAVALTKRAEGLLSDDDTAATRMKVLEAAIKVLTKAGKKDETKPYLAQIAKLEQRDHDEYVKAFPFKPESFAGRKAKSDRTVLVELFTGAECPPCVAADLAFDGLMKTYKPADVVLLQYHVHIPGPDPLTSPDSMKRVEEFYADQVRGAPSLFIGGKPGAPGGGPAAAAEKKYAAIRTLIEEGLEKPAGVKLGLTLGKGEKGGFSAKATVTDLATPGEKIMLRFALAEEQIRYTGGNGVRYHHMVVRAMPGGPKGFALTKKTTDQTVTFDLDQLRASLTKYLDDFAKNEGEFPRPDRPLALKNLKLIAFVQNDDTREVLHAIQVDVEAK